MLQESTRVIFIGYSLPENDVEVIYLLKRGLRHLEPEAITVVEWDEDRASASDHYVGQRFQAVFGKGIDWHPEGFGDWLSGLDDGNAS